MQKTKSFLKQSYTKLEKKFMDKIPKIFPLNERMKNMLMSVVSIVEGTEIIIIK